MLPKRKSIFKIALEELRRAYEKMVYEEEDFIDAEDKEACERLIKLCRNVACVTERKKDETKET